MADRRDDDRFENQILSDVLGKQSVQAALLEAYEALLKRQDVLEDALDRNIMGSTGLLQERLALLTGLVTGKAYASWKGLTPQDRLALGKILFGADFNKPEDALATARGAAKDPNSVRGDAAKVGLAFAGIVAVVESLFDVPDRLAASASQTDYKEEAVVDAAAAVRAFLTALESQVRASLAAKDGLFDSWSDFLTDAELADVRDELAAGVKAWPATARARSVADENCARFVAAQDAFRAKLARIAKIPAA